MSHAHAASMRRRDLLALIGTAAGGAAMYRAMTSLGLAAESTYAGPIKLDGDPKGASVLILGAGLAGMVAALELRKAGYRVQVLEYSDRAGGRWPILEISRGRSLAALLICGLCASTSLYYSFFAGCLLLLQVFDDVVILSPHRIFGLLALDLFGHIAHFGW